MVHSTNKTANESDLTANESDFISSIWGAGGGGGGGLCCSGSIVQELCESRGGRPGLSVLTNLLVFVDVKYY